MEFRSRVCFPERSLKCTKDFNYKGYTHHATKDDPQYEIKSDKIRSYSGAQRKSAAKDQVIFLTPGKVFMEVWNRFNSFIIILNIIFFIGRMKIVTIQSKAHKNDFNASSFSRMEQIGILPPPRTGIGTFPKVFFMLLKPPYILCCQ